MNPSPDLERTGAEVRSLLAAIFILLSRPYRASVAKARLPGKSELLEVQAKVLIRTCVKGEPGDDRKGG